MDYKLIIFDLDNTFYEGNKFALRLILNNLRQMMWMRAERKTRKALSGHDFKDNASFRIKMFDSMSSICGVPAAKLSQWYDENYLPSMTKILKNNYSVRGETAEMIDRLIDKGCVVTVLSDYPKTRERMEAIGLINNNVHTYSSEEFGALKPAPRPYTAIAEEHHIAPQETLVIGDRADTDGMGAVNAGMHCILLEGKKAQNDMGLVVLPWTKIVKTLTI